MESKAKLLGHSIHQMLVVFPLGLLATSVIFDLVSFAGGRSSMGIVAYWMMAAGLLGGLVAAPFGWVDWLAIPKGTRAKAVGLMHGLGNVVVLVLFALSWWLRSDDPEVPPTVAHVLSLAGVALAAVTAWLGGELVARLGIGVYDDAGVDAPSSLHRDARRSRDRAHAASARTR
jgi:uncharacterized membrane protein